MITLLSKLLIKNRENTSSPAVRQAYGMLCGAAGIFLNLLLSAGKLLAGALSRSIAVTADALNNLSDAASSIITLVGFKMAGQDADEDHPFGHGRIEYISGLLVSIIILIMAFELLKSSFLKILHPQPVSFSLPILLILVLSIAVKCYMACYNRKIGIKINSSAMKATALDSLSDCIATGAVLLSALTEYFTDLQIDGYCGILVGFFILYAGIRAAGDTISPLLGQAPEPEFVESVHRIALSHDMILGLHDLIVHNYGPGRTLLSFHAEVPADRDLLTLHQVIDDIEHELQNELHCHAVIHMDPVAPAEDEETIRVKEIIRHYLSDLDERITFHDFRLAKCGPETKISFDIIVPYHFSLSEEALITGIKEHLSRENPHYHAVIEVDRA